MLSHYLMIMFDFNEKYHDYNTRSSYPLHLPEHRTISDQHNIWYSGPKFRHHHYVKDSPSLNCNKSRFKIIFVCDRVFREVAICKSFSPYIFEHTKNWRVNVETKNMPMNDRHDLIFLICFTRLANRLTQFSKYQRSCCIKT